MNKHLAESDLATPKVTTGPIAGSRKIYVAARRRARAAGAAARDRARCRRPASRRCRSTTRPAPIPIPTAAHRSWRRACRAPRIEWVKERGGVEEYEGRPIKPVDNGNVSGKHLARNFPNTPQPYARRWTASRSPSSNGRARASSPRK